MIATIIKGLLILFALATVFSIVFAILATRYSNRCLNGYQRRTSRISGGKVHVIQPDRDVVGDGAWITQAKYPKPARSRDVEEPRGA